MKSGGFGFSDTGISRSRGGCVKEAAIPRATKQRLGLDGERSWIITSELNRFIWPGPDLRALPSGEYSYGYLPAKLVRAVIDQIRAHAGRGALSTVTRGR